MREFSVYHVINTMKRKLLSLSVVLTMLLGSVQVNAKDVSAVLLDFTENKTAVIINSDLPQKTISTAVENLVFDGKFEDVDDIPKTAIGSYAAGLWAAVSGTARVLDDDSAPGTTKKISELILLDGADDDSSFFMQRIKLEAGKSYYYSSQHKTDNGSGELRLSLYKATNDEEQNFTARYRHQLNGVNDWTKLEYILQIPENSDSLWLEIGLFSSEKGTSLLSTEFELYEEIIEVNFLPDNRAKNEAKEDPVKEKDEPPVIGEVKPRPVSNKVIHTPNVPFTDISDAKWALEAIETFYRFGFINGVSKTEFMPHNNITREEFIKIFINVFRLNDDTAECNFTDIEKTRWSYRYIASAYQKGIVEGVSDTEFGAGEKITRQDIATMAYRMINNLNLSIAQGDREYSYEGVAEYAREAVERLSGAGILYPLENGLNPGTYATRADAVTILYHVYKHIY